MTSPTQISQASALTSLRYAAQHNTANASALDINVYLAAGVTGLGGGEHISAYNSALDSAAVTGAKANTPAKLQAVVDAYNGIFAQSGGYAGVPLPPPTAAQFAAIGVTSLQAGSHALQLLDSSLYGVGADHVDTVAEVQAMATAANHIMAAAGGTARQAAALTVQDFSNLGISGVSAENLSQVQSIIRSVALDAELVHKYDVQAQIDARLGHNAEAAVTLIRTAATYNTASASTLGTDIYATANVHGVDNSNLASINSALNTTAISTFDILRTSDVQDIVDAYSAILHSADGVAGNTAVALTGAQYAKVGVTGLGSTATEGSALHLLNDTLDGLRSAAVDRVPELQALADAANHVMESIHTPADTYSRVLTLQDLRVLGITGVTSDNLWAVQYSLRAYATAEAVDTHVELQNFANAHHAVIQA